MPKKILKNQPAVVAMARPDEEEEYTFTTTKKRLGFQWMQTEFRYVDGRRAGVLKLGVHIELARGIQFKPKAFCAAFRGEGWKPGELSQKVEELIDFLAEKADDRARPEVLHWEDRPRPMAQIVLEGENADLRAKLAALESGFAAAVEKNPELAALRDKVMAGA